MAEKTRWQHFCAGLLLVAMLLALGLGQAQITPVHADDDDDDDDDGNASYITDQVVVKLDPIAGGSIDAVNSDYGTVTLEALMGSAGIYLLQTPSGQDAADLANTMENDVRLLYVEPNFIGEAPESDGRSRGAFGGQDDRPYYEQYPSNMLELSCAHTMNRGSGAVVAVLDTGVQLDHPALADSLTSTRYDFVDDDPTPADDGNGIVVGHGTHVAGVINLVAPDAQIMPLRVLNPDGQGNVFVIAEAIIYAAQNGADVINLSLGTSSASELLEDVIEDAAENYGVVIVAAAGNRNSSAAQYPASESDVLAVASIGPASQKSGFSNYGAWINVAAPGEGIYSTLPTSGYGSWSGTSMATPFVAGQAALVNSISPSLSSEQVALLITNTAQSIDAQNPDFAGLLGAGQLNIVASLEYASGNGAGCGHGSGDGGNNGNNGNDGNNGEDNNEDEGDDDNDDDDDEDEEEDDDDDNDDDNNDEDN